MTDLRIKSTSLIKLIIKQNARDYDNNSVLFVSTNGCDAETACSIASGGLAAIDAHFQWHRPRCSSALVWYRCHVNPQLIPLPALNSRHKLCICYPLSLVTVSVKLKLILLQKHTNEGESNHFNHLPKLNARKPGHKSHNNYIPLLM